MRLRSAGKIQCISNLWLPRLNLQYLETATVPRYIDGYPVVTAIDRSLSCVWKITKGSKTAQGSGLQNIPYLVGPFWNLEVASNCPGD